MRSDPMPYIITAGAACFFCGYLAGWLITRARKSAFYHSTWNSARKFYTELYASQDKAGL